MTRKTQQEVKTIFGHTMRVDPSDYIGGQIIAHGIYDRPTLDLLLKILPQVQPRTILDVGANIGNHALALAGNCQRLLAFEPGSVAYGFLSANVSGNPVRNVETLNFGLSDADAKLTLYVNSQGNLGGSSLHAANRHEADAEEEVLLRNGDSYLREAGVADVDFMKVDVEGHERQVFAGLSATIAQCRPIIQMEWDAASSDRQWLSDESAFRESFPGYEAYALIWNSNIAYWSRKPFGVLRRHLVRLFTRKQRVLTKFDPVAHQTRVNDLLLVPREKAACLAGVVYS